MNVVFRQVKVCWPVIPVVYTPDCVRPPRPLHRERPRTYTSTRQYDCYKDVLYIENVLVPTHYTGTGQYGCYEDVLYIKNVLVPTQVQDNVVVTRTSSTYRTSSFLNRFRTTWLAPRVYKDCCRLFFCTIILVFLIKYSFVSLTGIIISPKQSIGQHDVYSKGQIARGIELTPKNISSCFRSNEGVFVEWGVPGRRRLFFGLLRSFEIEIWFDLKVIGGFWGPSREPRRFHQHLGIPVKSVPKYIATVLVESVHIATLSIKLIQRVIVREALQAMQPILWTLCSVQCAFCVVAQCAQKHVVVCYYVPVNLSTVQSELDKDTPLFNISCQCAFKSKIVS